ncbi:MAG: hypothetical protein WBA93_05200 [Microcoleaceae cyanobacterium]
MLIVATPQEANATWFQPDEVMKYWHQWQQRVAEFWQLQGAAQHTTFVDFCHLC